MYGKPFTSGPAFLAAAAANIYVPGASTFALVRQIRLVNKDASTRTATLYIGASGGSAAGTEILSGYSIAAADFLDLYFQDLRLDTSTFLTGLASAANTVTCTVIGALYVV